MDASQSSDPSSLGGVPAAARTPLVIRDTAAKRAKVISTDFFAFDDADNRYGLRTS